MWQGRAWPIGSGGDQHKLSTLYWGFLLLTRGGLRPPGRHRLGARASRPHPVRLAAAELQCDAAGGHPVGGNSIGQAEGDLWRCSQSIPTGEMAERCAKLCAGGTPALPGSLHHMRSLHQGDKSAEAFWLRLSLREVHLSSCLFVFIRGSSLFAIGFISDRPFFLE